MPVILMPLAFLAWAWALGRKRRFYDAMLGATIVVESFLVFSTEVLSPLLAITAPVLITAWTVFLVAGIWWGAKTESLIQPTEKTTWLGWLSLLITLGVSAVVGFTAWHSAPNSADAMAYHLPRVLYWVQAHSVAFFPTPYLNQIMLQPGAEYSVLHTWLLSGGDHYVNLVQFFGYLGSIVGCAAVAEVMGLDSDLQAVAALVAATIPNAVLQASGAKNDCLLSFFLIASMYFAVQWGLHNSTFNLVFLGASAGLALCTKGTAYIFLVPLVTGAVLASRPARKVASWRTVALSLTAGALLLNGPQYVRNFQLSGSPLGFDSAQGDGVYRWRNESLGWKPMISNVLRNVSEQLGARSDSWNQSVFDAVVSLHAMLGLDLQDPATTWRNTVYVAPRNTNQEADANNRWQLVVMLLAMGLAAWTLDSRWLWWSAGLTVAFLVFCFYLKWQPFFARLSLPLFVASAPLCASLIQRLRSRILMGLVCIFLVTNVRRPLMENWTRPLQGSLSILKTPRDLQYFNDMTQWNNRESYLRSVEFAAANGCRNIGVDASINQLEYPFEALLRARVPGVRFRHVGVTNASTRYEDAASPPVCLVWCPDCAGDPSKLADYRNIGQPTEFGSFLVFSALGS